MRKSLQNITYRLMSAGALPRSAGYRATHYAFSPVGFAQYHFPEQCIVCLGTPITHVWSQPTDWGTFEDRGDHSAVTHGGLPRKAIPYCQAHVPASDVVTKGRGILSRVLFGREPSKGDMPGFKISTKTGNRTLDEVCLYFENPEYVETDEGGECPRCDDRGGCSSYWDFRLACYRGRRAGQTSLNSPSTASSVSAPASPSGAAASPVGAAPSPSPAAESAAWYAAVLTF